MLNRYFFSRVMCVRMSMQTKGRREACALMIIKAHATELKM